MSAIQNVGGSSPIQKVYTRPVARPPETQAAPSLYPTRCADRAELSGIGPLLKTLKAGGDVRAEKVASIKAQIEAGTYEDAQKLGLATDRMLDDLLK